MSLKIKDLSVSVNGKKIVKNVSLEVKENEVHALMGPNGSGKSTLALSIMGHPAYSVTGSVAFNDREITGLPTDKRAELGLFLSHQHPVEIEGLSLSNFLYMIAHEKKSVPAFNAELDSCLKLVNKEKDFVSRELNLGFSGGEKKKSELLQMLMARPKLAIIDEIDSGLDVDALKLVSGAINKLVGEGMSALIITHYARILDYVRPDFVHVMKNGEISRSGDLTLAKEIEATGYG